MDLVSTKLNENDFYKKCEEIKVRFCKGFCHRKDLKLDTRTERITVELSAERVISMNQFNLKPISWNQMEYHGKQDNSINNCHPNPSAYQQFERLENGFDGDLSTPFWVS